MIGYWTIHWNPYSTVMEIEVARKPFGLDPECRRNEGSLSFVWSDGREMHISWTAIKYAEYREK